MSNLERMAKEAITKIKAEEERKKVEETERFKVIREKMAKDFPPPKPAAPAEAPARAGSRIARDEAELAKIEAERAAKVAGWKNGIPPAADFSETEKLRAKAEEIRQRVRSERAMKATAKMSFMKNPLASDEDFERIWEEPGGLRDQMLLDGRPAGVSSRTRNAFGGW